RNAAWPRAACRCGRGRYLWPFPPSSPAGVQTLLPLCLPPHLLLRRPLLLLRRSLVLLRCRLLLRRSFVLRWSRFLHWLWARVSVLGAVAPHCSLDLQFRRVS